MSDLISRQAAIDALWKALHEYEDKTEKKFQESEDLDIQDWIQHRIFVLFVQNMSDIDRQTILNLPSAQPERRWIPCSERLPKKVGDYLVTTHNGQIARYIYMDNDTSKDYWMRCVTAWMPLPEPYRESDDV